MRGNLIFTGCFCLVFAAVCYFGRWNAPRLQEKARQVEAAGKRVSGPQYANLNHPMRWLWTGGLVAFAVLGVVLLIAGLLG